MNQDKYLAQVFISSVPLRRLDENCLPTGIASGCLIDYSGKRLLLTVSHATADQENWAIEIGYKKDEGTINYQLGAMYFLSEGSILTGNFKDIDFSYVEVPKDLVVFRQEIDMAGNIINQVPIQIFKPDFDVIPNSKEEYGFSGSVMPSIEHHQGKTYVFSELNIYSGLQFVKEENQFYIFKLPMKHPGHDHFRGCSGAPIIDRKGNVVALVCSGSEETSEIYAVAIKKYRVVLDILTGNI